MRAIQFVVALVAVSAVIVVDVRAEADEGRDKLVGKWRVTAAEVDGKRCDFLSGERWIFFDNGKALVWAEQYDHTWTYDAQVKMLTMKEKGIRVEAVSRFDVKWGDADTFHVSGTKKVSATKKDVGRAIEIKYNLDFKRTD
jgi:hypothetical protein